MRISCITTAASWSLRLDSLWETSHRHKREASSLIRFSRGSVHASWRRRGAEERPPFGGVSGGGRAQRREEAEAPISPSPARLEKAEEELQPRQQLAARTCSSSGAASSRDLLLERELASLPPLCPARLPGTELLAGRAPLERPAVERCAVFARQQPKQPSLPFGASVGRLVSGEASAGSGLRLSPWDSLRGHSELAAALRRPGGAGPRWCFCWGE